MVFFNFLKIHSIKTLQALGQVHQNYTVTTGKKFVLIGTLLITCGFLFVQTNFKSTLKISFPVLTGKSSHFILNPDKTQMVSEHNLLENLSCGLVKADNLSLTDFSGCLADYFYQQDQTTWIFKLKELNWSDGTQVTKMEILFWINKLATTQKPHIQNLKTIKSYTYDDSNRILKLYFKNPTGSEVLHELSLAESGLFSESSYKNNWSKTIGAYYVERWDSKLKTLILKANKFSVLYNNDIPQRIELTHHDSTNDRIHALLDNRTDLLTVYDTWNPEVSNKLANPDVSKFDGHPTLILYLLFNQKNPSAHNKQFRQAIHSVIQNYQNTVSDSSLESAGLKIENQLIPFGFEGRVDQVPTHQPNLGLLNGKTITLKVFKSLSSNSLLTEGLVNAFKTKGCKLILDYANYDSDNLPSDYVGKVYGFMGNQYDPWSYLAHPKTGLFRDWKSIYLADLKNIFESGTQEIRNRNFTFLHQRILSNSIAIPLWVGSQRFYHRHAISLDRWNKLDTNTRFYEIRFN